MKNKSSPSSDHNTHLETINSMAKTASPSQTSIERAIGDLRRGALVILRDTSNQTAAVIQAAEMATSMGLKIITQIAGSQPTVAITNHRALAINIPNQSGRILSIGLSPNDDATLIHQIANPTFTGKENDTDFQPLNPAMLSIIPEESGGIADRAIQLVKYARLLPSAVFARIPLAEVDQLSNLTKNNGLLLVESASVKSFPKLRAQRLVQATSAKVPLADAEEAELIAFRPVDGGDEHLAIIIGKIDITNPVLVRLHSQCLTGDLLGSLRCDCGDQLRGAIQAIEGFGGGILIYLAQEGRDIGLINKLRAYSIQDLGVDTVDANKQLGFEPDERLYAPAAEILKQLRVQSVRLLTNNPDKLQQLSTAGVKVVERVAHIFPSNPHNANYLETKAKKAGHLF